MKKYTKWLENFKVDNLNKYTKDFKSVVSVILIFIIITILIKSLFFYRGIYFAPKKGLHDLSIFSIEPEAKKFIDVFGKTKGSIVIDKSHENDFKNNEIDTLVLRITSRNNKIEFLEEANDLQKKLRLANSFIIILPKKDFSRDEIDLIKEFVSKNGKLLLIGDPDRESNINSVANNFNIIFSEDYLYNLKENDDNFRFIFLNEFSKNELTKKLNKIAFYASCPIFPLEKGIVFTDKNTYASSLEPNKFTPVVFLNNFTLALCDLTFFNQPFNSVADNNQFISNIADFLTKADRKFNIADFPYFFKENVAIVTTNLGLSSIAVDLKNRLSKAGINANIRRLNASIDTIVIELFDDFSTTPIKNLAVDEVSFRINDLLFDRKDSSLIHLSMGNVTVLTILSNNKKSMEKTIEILEGKEISESLIEDNIAVISGLEVEEEKTNKE